LESYTLGEIASRVRGTLIGDAGVRVTGIKPLDQAGPEDLSFIALPRYRRVAAASRAAALLAREADAPPGRNVIVVPNPYAALACAMGLFHREERPAAGISPLAVLGEDCVLGDGVSIGPFAVLGRRCRVGSRSALLPGVTLGDDVTIGDDCVLHPAVVLYPKSVLGERVVVHAGAVIGSDGFGYAEAGGGRTKIPQVGNVVVGDDVEIGAGTTIDRATFGSTVIGAGTKIDNLVQIGHNVVVGEGSVLVAQVGIAGSTRLGRGVVLAGRGGAAGHLTIGDGAAIGAAAVLLEDLEPGRFVLGYPAVDHREWKRQQAALRRLPQVLHRLARLEKAAPAGRGAVAAGRRRAGGRRRGGAARA
jgi:UDP-3-O-[3-hydroxymyristoyl] glucosamine N-acyltransferase